MNKGLPVAIYSYPIVWSNVQSETTEGFIKVSNTFGTHYVPLMEIKRNSVELYVNGEWIDITYTRTWSKDGTIAFDFNLLPIEILDSLYDMICEQKATRANA